jgi:hypothetical protein
VRTAALARLTPVIRCSRNRHSREPAGAHRKSSAQPRRHLRCADGILAHIVYPGDVERVLAAGVSLPPGVGSRVVVGTATGAEIDNRLTGTTSSPSSSSNSTRRTMLSSRCLTTGSYGNANRPHTGLPRRRSAHQAAALPLWRSPYRRVEITENSATIANTLNTHRIGRVVNGAAQTEPDVPLGQLVQDVAGIRQCLKGGRARRMPTVDGSCHTWSTRATARTRFAPTATTCGTSLCS